MIIKSILDTDLYKFTMQQAVLHQFPDIEVEYKFKCRTKGINFKPSINEIKKEIINLEKLKLSQEEESYLYTLRFLKPDYIRFLKLFRFNLNYLSVKEEPNGDLEIHIKGPWVHTILFEVPVLSIISEVYKRRNIFFKNYPYLKLLEKVNSLKNYNQSIIKTNYLKFADFGTRRRFTKYWQEFVIQYLIQEIPENFIGTSNVYFAKKFKIKPIGTMAHEWIQAHQQLKYRLVDSQKIAFENWVKEYRGDLGIALTDTIGHSEFMNDFDLYFCKLFDGVRHDSGDPFLFAKRMIDFYKNMGIDPKTKTIVFSDGLNFEKMIELHNSFYKDITVSFGIGTDLTNDVGFRPLQIVLKMVKCNGQHVAKISDDSGKGMCEDEDFLKYLKEVFRKENN